MKFLRSSFESPMAWTMFWTLLVSVILCAVFAVIYGTVMQEWLLSMAITFGTIAYHMAIRFLIAGILSCVTRGTYDHTSYWFREKPWEAKLYRVLRVKRWKKHALTYAPSQFSTEQYSIEEIVSHTCHAEAVHEWIVLFSMASLLFAIPFGAFAVFLVTALMASLFDLSFVLIQRYNRPRLVRILHKTLGENYESRAKQNH